MRTLIATATIDPNHMLTVQVPADIPPGAHQVVVVLEDVPTTGEALIVNWPAHNVGLSDPAMTFRREDLYGDDGR
jgi:hypothetical protein